MIVKVVKVVNVNAKVVKLVNWNFQTVPKLQILTGDRFWNS